MLNTRTYWVSFLTNEGKGARKVARAISETVRLLAERDVWETASFYVFDSYATIDHIATQLRFQRRVKDVFLIGSFTHAECRVVGPCEDPSFYDLVPFARRANRAERGAKPNFPANVLAAWHHQAMAQLAKAQRGQSVSDTGDAETGTEAETEAEFSLVEAAETVAK